MIRKKIYKYTRNILISILLFLGLSYLYIKNIEIIEPSTEELSLNELSNILNYSRLKDGKLLWSYQGIFRENMGGDTGSGQYIVHFKLPSEFKFKELYSYLNQSFKSKSKINTLLPNSKDNIDIELIKNQKKTLEEKLGIPIVDPIRYHYFKAKNPNSVLDMKLDYYITKNDSYLKITDLTFNPTFKK